MFLDEGDDTGTDGGVVDAPATTPADGDEEDGKGGIDTNAAI